MSSVKVGDFQQKVDLPAKESDVLDYWDSTDAFRKSVEERPESKTYHFYDGPPFATGLPHYGHIVASLMKDVVPRYWTMKGYRVERKWGWDCHGLPVENIVEKELNLKSKRDIETYGVGQFNEYCRGVVLRYTEEWKKTIRRMGRWVDMENDYKTMDPEFMESVWWVFSQLWKKGLVYRDYKAMHICPRCVTPLSNFEVTQGYKDVKDLSVYVKFRLTNAPAAWGTAPVFAVAWTTTPWTLPGNVLLAVGPDVTYVLAKAGDALYLLARDLADTVFEGVPHETVKTMTGREVADLKLTYEPLFGYFRDTDKAFRVVAAEFVETGEGTGIVHIAPAFGENDYALGKAEGVGFVQHVTMEGRFTADVTDFAGKPVKPKDNPSVTDREVVTFLESQGKVVRTQVVQHSYPHCWRCDTPLLNYATSSWFVRVTELKTQLLANNQRIRWVPEHMKEGRFGQWLEGVRDWAVSRNRYWGTPLPVWMSDEGDMVCVGSVAELETLTGTKVADLHKHKIDSLTFVKDGKTYKRIPEVFDCWFESGSMPYGQMHYPFENREKFKASFPAQFIAEGQDQTRGWFYTLHVLATALSMPPEPAVGDGGTMPAFYNVIVNGIVLAEDGKKMSKRLKNYPDPEEVLSKYGADAMRYYLVSSPVMEAESLNFSETGVRETYNKVISTLWNVVSFYRLFAPADAVKQGPSTHVLDRWILSRLHRLIREVTAEMDAYHLIDASRPIGDFVTELSQWYVRRSRERIKDGGPDAAAAASTLNTVLETLAMVMAPFTPFIAELVYQNTGDRSGSVHLQSWPAYDAGLIDDALEADMAAARAVVEKLLAKRKEVAIPIRQPLADATVTGQVPLMSEGLIDVIMAETNIRHITVVPGKGEMEVGLDTNLTPELKLEGRVRDLVRKVQTIRKEKGCTMDARIGLTLPEEYRDLPQEYLDAVTRDTLADTLVWGASLDVSIRSSSS